MSGEDSSDDSSERISRELAWHEAMARRKSVCLFCPLKLVGVDPMLKHMTEVHNINMLSVRCHLSVMNDRRAARYDLDDYAWIQMVNFIRKTCATPQEVMKAIKEKETPWTLGEFYRPAIRDDILIQWDPDELAAEAMVEDIMMNSFLSPLEALQAKIRTAEASKELTEKALERALGDLKNIREVTHVYLATPPQPPTASLTMPRKALSSSSTAKHGERAKVLLLGEDLGTADDKKTSETGQEDCAEPVAAAAAAASSSSASKVGETAEDADDSDEESLPALASEEPDKTDAATAPTPTSADTSSGVKAEAGKEKAGGEEEEEDDADDDSDDDTDDETDPYFLSYANVAIHREMLQDTVRTQSYCDFIMKNADAFKGKVVLDVGCGTAILSMFAARAGAAKVYAVDQSTIVYQAMAIVRENKLENVIKVIRGQVEHISLDEKVDIIISEWMGYFLLYESMLDTVISARDKWLAPGGHVFPGRFTMHMVGVADPTLTTKLDYWKDVYGFSMKSMRSSDLFEAEVMAVDPSTIVTDPALFKTIDAQTATVADLEFSTNFVMEYHKSAFITAFACYFDTHFASNEDQQQVEFSCSPSSPLTHWKQTVFVLDEPLDIEEEGTIECTIAVKKQKKHQRALHVALRLTLKDAYGDVERRRVQDFVIQ